MEKEVDMWDFLESTTDTAAWHFFEWAAEMPESEKSRFDYLGSLVENWVECGEGLKACGDNFQLFQGAVVVIIHVWHWRNEGLDPQLTKEEFGEIIPARITLALNPNEKRHNILDPYWFDYLKVNQPR